MTQVRKQNAILNAILLKVMKIYPQSSKKEAKVTTRQLQQYLWQKNFLLYNPWGNIPPLSKTLGGLEDEKKNKSLDLCLTLLTPTEAKSYCYCSRSSFFMRRVNDFGSQPRAPFFQSVEVKMKKNSLKQHLTGCVHVRKSFEIHGPPGCHKDSAYTKDFNY